MGLREYHAKRDFRRTREPQGSTKSRRGWLYVIQKHDASRLHYDFRLQLGSVLLSWAVPKGPSLDPTIKRLAMHVEDHPVDYGGFEGIIPAGEYGGGTVMLWDRGHWEPEGDPAEGYRQGKLKFRLFGKKLQGDWHLIRTGGHRAGERAWLLFKVKDKFARRENSYDVTEEEPDSVKTGRTLAEIAKAEDAVWSSNRADPETKCAAHQAAAKTLSRVGAAEANSRVGRKLERPKKKTAKTAARRRKTSRKSTRSGVKTTSKASTRRKSEPGDLPGAVRARLLQSRRASALNSPRSPSKRLAAINGCTKSSSMAIGWSRARTASVLNSTAATTLIGPRDLDRLSRQFAHCQSTK